MLDDLRFRLRTLIRRNAVEDDLDDELRFHLERAAEQHMARGLSPREARRQARLAFGQLDAVKDECRQSWGIRQLDVLHQDVAYALRLIRKHPALSAVAAVSLAIGIGLNTALFALLDATILRRLPGRSTGAARRRLHQRRRRLLLVRKLVPGLPRSAPRHPDTCRSGGLRARGGSRQDRRPDPGDSRRNSHGQLLSASRCSGDARAHVAAG